MEVKLEQAEKAFSPIWMTESGIVTAVNLWQLWKAKSFICVTESGIVKELSPFPTAYRNNSVPSFE